MAKILVIDLDGTLADTNKDLLAVLNRTIASESLAPLKVSDLGYIFGSGAKAMIAHAFALNNRPLDEATHEELFLKFLADYESNIAVETTLFDACLETLDTLANKGWVLAICTNKLEYLAKKLIEELGLTERFTAICGSDTFENRKPHRDHILKTIEMAGGDISKAVMLGDSITDIAAARASGVPVIAVTFGYSDKPIETLDPDCVIDHYSQLPTALRKLGFEA